MLDIPNSSKTKLANLCSALGGLSLKTLCEGANVNYKTLNSQVNKGRLIPFETIDAICCAWDIPHTYFSKQAPLMGVLSEKHEGALSKSIHCAANRQLQKSSQMMLGHGDLINTKDFLDWLHYTGGDISKSDDMLQYVDLFRPMEDSDEIPKPFRCGQLSLSSLYFKIDSEQDYINRVSNFDPSILTSTKESHIRARNKPYDVSTVFIDTLVDGEKVIECYRRVIGKGLYEGQTEVTIVHAELLPRVTKQALIRLGID